MVTALSLPPVKCQSEPELAKYFRKSALKPEIIIAVWSKLEQKVDARPVFDTLEEICNERKIAG